MASNSFLSEQYKTGIHCPQPIKDTHKCSTLTSHLKIWLADKYKCRTNSCQMRNSVLDVKVIVVACLHVFLKCGHNDYFSPLLSQSCLSCMNCFDVLCLCLIQFCVICCMFLSICFRPIVKVNVIFLRVFFFTFLFLLYSIYFILQWVTISF